MISSWEGPRDLQEVTLILKEAGGTTGAWQAGVGEQAFSGVRPGGWPALRWPDCRQAQACLLGLVPPNGLPGSPTFPLETKAPASPPGPSASRRAQTDLSSAPWTSTWASGREAPLLGMPFPRGPLWLVECHLFQEVLPLLWPQLHVLCAWRSGPCPLQGLHRAPRAGPAALRGLMADPMAESRWPKVADNGWPQGRSSGP